MTSLETPRRSPLRAALALAVAALLALPLSGLALAPAAAADAPAVSLGALQVEKKTEPIGIDVERPRFSWIIDSTKRAVVQQSYRLQVAPTAAALSAGEGWDSGVVASIESSNVEYDGPELASAHRYFWKVDVVTNVGAASATSEFRTGLYNPETDWADSEWIGNARLQSASPVEMSLTNAGWIHPPYTGTNTPPGYFRKSFTLDDAKTIESAEFVLAGDRGAAAYLNGVQVASSPSVDDQWKKAARVVVTPLAGQNLLAIRLNNTAKTYGAVVGKLTVLYTDGTTQDIVTDATWLSSTTANVGWASNGYDTTGWVAAAQRALYGGSPWGSQVSIPAAASADTRLTFDTAAWTTAELVNDTVPSALFRRVITTEPGKEVAWAKLAITGDQIFTAYWNGEQVAFNTGANNEWQSARTVSLPVTTGDNALAVSLATSNSQYGGILASVRIGYTDGTSTDFASGSSMKALASTEAAAPEGWKTIAFDDSAWTNARAQYLYRGWVYGDRVSIPELAIGAEPLNFTNVPWIFTPEASTGSAPGEDRAFRTTRSTPAGLTAKSAEIIITADDSYTLWVNGAKLGESDGATNGWQQSYRYTTDLAATSNTFAVRTTNGANSPAGLLAKVRVTYTDDSTSTFTTGTDWKASKTIDPGFQQIAFDDSGWGNAVQQAVYGSGPWGSGVRLPKPAPAAAPLLRKDFGVDGPVATATLFLAAGGYADVSLNGEPISDDLLSPGFTDYDDTVQYVAKDVTGLLDQGDNAIGMELGRGFYGMTGSNVWNWQSPPWHDEPVARAVLHIEYVDGTTDRLVTDSSWTIHDGPTLFDDLYGGERFDAGRVIPDYDTAGFDDTTWEPASEVKGPKGVLVNQRQQPIRETEALSAISMTEPVDGKYVVKFPRMLAGNVQITATGADGDEITVKYAEKLRSSGLLNMDNNGGFGSGFQTDRFILAGTGQPETWQAHFSYKGFQYIEVSGWPAGSEPTLANFTAKAVHTDAAETGTFESANDIMNRTHTAVVDTLENNIHGIPTDTPMFEKNGWTGDAAIGAEMFLMNLDTHELFAKWMRDVNESRDAEGAPMVIAPSSANWGEWGINTPWHSAYILIPRWLYQYGNDDRVMTEYYEGMKGYIDLEFDRSTNGLVTNPRLGDWVSPEASPAGGNAPEDTRVSGTAYLYTMLVAMSDTAAFLGHDADAEQFAADAAVVKTAFNTAFYKASRGYYVGTGDSGYRQTHNVLALAFGLTPNADAATSTALSIVADIKAKGNHLNTGVLGTKYLLPVLTQYGYEDVAYTLATQTTYPSWGYIMENGGTSMWEHWSLEARSLGHYFLGTVDDWFYHSVAGIQASPTAGYREITIQPAVTRQLAWAKGSVESPFGTVATDWSSSGGQLRLDVDIPVGTTAKIHIPAANLTAVTEGGKTLDIVDGVQGTELAGDTIIVTVGSGHYSFVSGDAAGRIGDILTSLDAVTAALTQLRAEGKVSWTQQTKLQKLIAATRTQALSALARTRSSTPASTATALASTLTKLGALDKGITALGAVPRTALRPLAATVRTQTYETITSILGVDLSASLDKASYAPGEKPKAIISVANGGISSITAVSAKITGLPTGWKSTPSSKVLSKKLTATKTARGTFALTIPGSQLPGDQTGTANASFVFGGATVRLTEKFDISVTSTVRLHDAVVDPSPVAPGSTTTLTAKVTNDGTQSISGRLRLEVPEGWVTPLASEAIAVPAGATKTVSVPVFIPRNAAAASRAFALTARFARGDAVYAATEASVTVAITPIANLTPYDHVDLGNGTSESAHALTASPTSGSNTEAGLTRRYAGHLTDYSWFAFDVDVEAGKPFVLRSTETYDRSQTKRYKVYVDDVEVALRQEAHTTGAGTETWEFVVGAEHATSGTVRVKFENQEDHSYYDPSIADVWSLPLAALDNGPQVVATYEPYTPNDVTGWFRQTSVIVTLDARATIGGDVDMEYSLDGATPVAYAGPFTITGQKNHALVITATDAAGTTTTAEHAVRIDTVAPKTTVKLSGRTVTLTATDATSGPATTKYRVNGGSWKTGTTFALSKKGTFTVQYASTDAAGNVERSVTTKVTVRR